MNDARRRINQIVTLHIQTETSKSPPPKKKLMEGVGVFNPDITGSNVCERPQGLKSLHEPQYSVSTRNLNELRVKPPKWSDFIIKSMNQLRVAEYLRFLSSVKGARNYGITERVCWAMRGMLRGSNVVAVIWRNLTKRTKWKNRFLLFMPKNLVSQDGGHIVLDQTYFGCPTL